MPDAEVRVDVCPEAIQGVDVDLDPTEMRRRLQAKFQKQGRKDDRNDAEGAVLQKPARHPLRITLLPPPDQSDMAALSLPPQRYGGRLGLEHDQRNARGGSSRHDDASRSPC